ncbi:MAG: type II toxin-antitoxin system HicB family antitoxin [Selenomonadaceae bacterium]|nr:type II toxin-antitoxin system HicB family antitoxin [Selenomonadaceae bacterium]
MAEKKTVAYYMALPYQEVIVSAKEGGYVGYIPELKGCITQAETRQGILDMLEDAKKCWLEAALEDGLDIPEPHDDTEYSGKFNLRIPKSLHRTLAWTARKEGVSLNQMAMYAIASGLNVPLKPPKATIHE